MKLFLLIYILCGCLFAAVTFVRDTFAIWDVAPELADTRAGHWATSAIVVKEMLVWPLSLVLMTWVAWLVNKRRKQLVDRLGKTAPPEPQKLPPPEPLPYPVDHTCVECGRKVVSIADGTRVDAAWMEEDFGHMEVGYWCSDCSSSLNELKRALQVARERQQS